MTAIGSFLTSAFSFGGPSVAGGAGAASSGWGYPAIEPYGGGQGPAYPSGASSARGGESGVNFDFGAIGKAFEQIGAIKAQQDQLKYQAQLAEYEAQLREMEAANLEVQGSRNRAREGRNIRARIAALRQQGGEHGVFGGTFGDAVMQTAALQGQDNDTSFYNEAQFPAYQKRQAAQMSRYTASNLKKQSSRLSFGYVAPLFGAAVKLTGGGGTGGGYNPFARSTYS